MKLNHLEKAIEVLFVFLDLGRGFCNLEFLPLLFIAMSDISIIVCLMCELHQYITS